ncbi:hypothetical protein FHY55_18350 [Oceanicola sp. D3]|uniref:ABZJ_00895 family protein n=1 Tax=Oceanicola sp. D3 TaxID=2587163 RepID=UPI001123C792|nr:ABZJ_00895 family protein [Oceanicola sp. D3]QDC11073.1 hypothetical protein FHY55_18350 [Oceanicola sp. D3]
MRVNLMRYAGVYIAAAVGLAVLIWIADAAFGLRLPTGLSTALPPMLAALLEGQAFARAYRELAPNGEAWSIALRMTLVVAVINAVILLGMLLFTPQLADPEAFGIIAVVFVVLLGLVLVVNRVFFGMGVKSQLKALEGGK